MSGGTFDTADCRKTWEKLKAKGVESPTHPPSASAAPRPR